MAEHREHPRAPIELRVDYRSINSFFADYTRNISKGGTFIKTSRLLPLGTRFLFRLAVPGRKEPFDLAGEVAHADSKGEEAGMGIRFVWKSAAEQRTFGELVERLMSDSLGSSVAQALLEQSKSRR